MRRRAQTVCWARTESERLIHGQMDELASFFCPLFTFSSSHGFCSRWSGSYSQLDHSWVNREPPYVWLSASTSPEAGTSAEPILAQATTGTSHSDSSVSPSIHYAANGPQLQPSHLSAHPLAPCVGFNCSLIHSNTQSAVSPTVSNQPRIHRHINLPPV